MQPINYARRCFPPEANQHAIWPYLRFTASRGASMSDAEHGERSGRGSGSSVWSLIMSRCVTYLVTSSFAELQEQTGG